MIPESYGIERVNIAALTAFSGNPRTHSDTQIDQIAASIREFGWTNPILVDAAGVIIAGHGRLAAATRLKLDQVPVSVAARADGGMKTSGAGGPVAQRALWAKGVVEAPPAFYDDAGFKERVEDLATEQSLPQIKSGRSDDGVLRAMGWAGGATR